MTTAILEKTWRAAIRPPERLKPSDWAERHLVLSERSTQFPGPFRFHRAPYMREMVDRLIDPRCEKIAFCKAAQAGGTQGLLAAVAYAIDQDPGPMLFVQSNTTLARSFSEQRLQPLIEDSAALRRHKPDTRDKWRKDEMHLDRMTIALVGSNSPANLASRPIRYLFCDEVDKYPSSTKKEAGALDLAEKRTRTYWNRKIYHTSTPTVPEGAIWRSFMEGDRRFYWVPCPHCGVLQKLIFEQLKWDKEAKTDNGWDLPKVRASTFYQCCHCEEPIKDRHKQKMLLEGQWQSEYGFDKHASYHLSALYPTWVSFGDMSTAFLECKPYPEKLRDFINSSLAEPWNERGDAADENQILAHRGTYAEGECPVDPLVVVITADVQKESIYYLIRAWGTYDTSWLLRYGQVENFDALEAVAKSVYRCPKGPLHVSHGYIDSGFQSDDVYRFCERSRFVALKGESTNTQNQQYRWSKMDRAKLLLVQGDYYKSLLQLKLKLKLDEPGAWHLHRDTRMDYAMHLTAEAEIEEKDKYGRPKRVWKRFDRDNHWLDCEVYQLAAAAALGVRFMDPHAQQQQAKRQVETDVILRRDGRDFWTR